MIKREWERAKQAKTKYYDERELETALISHVTQFLLELGSGFSFLGRQVPVQVGKKEYFIDLLFYHTSLPTIKEIENGLSQGVGKTWKVENGS